MTYTTIKSELKAFANKKVDYMRSYIELQEKLKKQVAEGMKEIGRASCRERV